MKIRNEDVSSEDTACFAQDCRVLPNPLYGSYHILFRLEFNDGVQWILESSLQRLPRRL